MNRTPRAIARDPRDVIEYDRQQRIRRMSFETPIRTCVHSRATPPRNLFSERSERHTGTSRTTEPEKADPRGTQDRTRPSQCFRMGCQSTRESGNRLHGNARNQSLLPTVYPNCRNMGRRHSQRAPTKGSCGIDSSRADFFRSSGRPPLSRALQSPGANRGS